MQNKHGVEKAVRLTEKGLEIGGKYEALLCGSLFYFRLPRAVWKDRILKLKRAGYRCADVYFPWNYHEREDGSFDFSGERDIRYFLEEMKAAGMYVVARPGPYICSEWNGGALPARILESGMPIRCADPAFLAETEKWYRAVLTEIAPYTYPNGGTVILLQIENELDFFDCPDPAAYIEGLTKIAKKYCDGVPCFCCAGQFDATRAGGFAGGVSPTYNCYPSSSDNVFDGDLQKYGLQLKERGLPLLVSETNRDHFLLRRELSCGSKLLGAYNQVAGVNFEYNQAVNNWGSPDAFLATIYDFWSMIDPIGNFRPEAEEAVLFAAFLGVAGQAIAAAVPSEELVFPSKCTFTTAAGGLRALALEGGGVAVCVPNFSEEGGITLAYRGTEVSATVLPNRAPFFLFGFNLAPNGIAARITRANCEPVAVRGHEIVFLLEAGEAQVGLDFGKGEILFNSNGTANGIFVKFVNRAEALALLGADVAARESVSRPLSQATKAEIPAWRELPVGEGTHFGALGITEGAAEYTVRISAGEELFVEHPCDMIRIGDGDVLHADGRDLVLPPEGDGVYRITAEKWGHSNFDDSQSPAIRISCKKGVTSFGAVRHNVTLGRCDFALLDEYGAKELPANDVFPVRLTVQKWNSTRKPVICAYTHPVTRLCDRLIVKTTEATDVAVYLDGKLVGECDYGSFELTDYLEKGKETALTLVYRKRVWTQDCGDVRLLHIDRVTPERVRVLASQDMVKPAAGEEGANEPISLPLSVGGGAAFRLKIDGSGERIVRFKGKNAKLTCVVGGRVVGRLLLGWEHAPALHGGEPNELYWCPDWGTEAYLYAEPLGKEACVAGAEVVSMR